MAADSRRSKERLEALRAADHSHACPAPLYTFDRTQDTDIIRCTGCRRTIWRSE